MYRKKQKLKGKKVFLFRIDSGLDYTLEHNQKYIKG